MQGKLMEWVIKYLLSKLDVETASEALVAVLRGGLSAIGEVAAKTETKLDDAAVAKAKEVVEQIAVMLKVS